MMRGIEAVRQLLAQHQLQTIDPSRGGVHLGTQPMAVQAQDPQQLEHIRKDFMVQGKATPIRLQNGAVVILAHGAPPINGVRHWFIGPSAAPYGSADGWLEEAQAKQWAAGRGYPGAKFMSCYNGGSGSGFDNTGKLEIGVPTDPSSTDFTVKTE